MEAQLIKLIKTRILEIGNTSCSMEQFEIDNLCYDVDYCASIQINEGMQSDDYDVLNDKDCLIVNVHEIHIRDVWDSNNKSFNYQELMELNRKFYIL